MYFKKRFVKFVSLFTATLLLYPQTNFICSSYRSNYKLAPITILPGAPSHNVGFPSSTIPVPFEVPWIEKNSFSIQGRTHFRALKDLWDFEHGVLKEKFSRQSWLQRLRDDFNSALIITPMKKSFQLTLYRPPTLPHNPLVRFIIHNAKKDPFVEYHSGLLKEVYLFNPEMMVRWKVAYKIASSPLLTELELKKFIEEQLKLELGQVEPDLVDQLYQEALSLRRTSILLNKNVSDEEGPPSQFDIATLQSNGTMTQYELQNDSPKIERYLSEDYKIVFKKNGSITLYYKNFPFAHLKENQKEIQSRPTKAFLVAKNKTNEEWLNVHYLSHLHNALSLIQRQTGIDPQVKDKIVNKLNKDLKLFDNHVYADLSQISRLMHHFRGTMPAREIKARMPREIYHEEKMKRAGILMDPKNEKDPTLLAFLGQFSDTSNIEPVVIFGNYPLGLWRNLKSSLYGDLYPSMTIETIYEDVVDEGTKDEFRYGLLRFNGKPVWVIPRINYVERILNRREELGLPEPNLNLDIIYSSYDAQEIEDIGILAEFFDDPYAVFTSSSPTESQKDGSPLLAVDVNEAFWGRSRKQMQSHTKKMSSSIVRITSLLFKTIYDELSSGTSPKEKVLLRDASIFISTQVLESPLIGKGGKDTSLGNQIEFSKEEKKALKSQFKAIMGSLGITFEENLGLEERRKQRRRKTDTTDVKVPRMKVFFNGLKNGTTSEIFFDLDEDFGKDKDKDEGEEEIKEKIKQKVRLILENNDVTKNIIQFEDSPVTTMDVIGRRKIFLGPEDIDIIAVKSASFQPEEDGPIIIKKYYRVKVKVTFDRYWQDARHLLRASEAFDSTREDIRDTRRIVRPNAKKSDVQERKEFALKRNMVSPFNIGTNRPLHDLTLEPLPVFIQAPRGRIGKVTIKQFMEQVISLSEEGTPFDGGYPNLRIVGLFSPAKETKSLLASISKDPIFGPLGAKVELKEYEDERDSIWGEITINGKQPIYLISNKKDDHYINPKQYRRGILRVMQLASLSPWQKKNITVYANAGQGYNDHRAKSVMRFKRAGVKWVVISAPWKEKPKSHETTTIVYNLSDLEKGFEESEGISPGSCTTNCGVFHVAMNKVLFGSNETFVEGLSFFDPSIHDSLKSIREEFKGKLREVLKRYVPSKREIKAGLLKIIANETGGNQEWLGKDFPRENEVLRELLTAIRRFGRQHFSHVGFDGEGLKKQNLSVHVNRMIGLEDLEELLPYVKKLYSPDKRRDFSKYLEQSIEQVLEFYQQNIESTHQLKGFLQSIHAWTNTQPTFDRVVAHFGQPKFDGKLAAADQISHAPTGFSKGAGAVMDLHPEEKLEAIALRVPEETGSVIHTQIPFIFDNLWLLSADAYHYPSADKKAKAKKAFQKVVQGIADVLENAINDAYRRAAKESFGGSLRFAQKEEMLTSAMIRGQKSTSIFDGGLTKVVAEARGGRLVFTVRSVLWYDNEYGFVAQVLGLLDRLSRFVDKDRDEHKSNPFESNPSPMGLTPFPQRRFTPSDIGIAASV